MLRVYLRPDLAPQDDFPDIRGWARWRPLVTHVAPLFLIFAFVIGAMSVGWATPTESAALGAIATVAVAALYRALSVRNLMSALLGTAAISGVILFIIVGATTFSQILSFSGAATGLVQLIAGQALPTALVILGMLLILLFLGCFVDQVSMMLITLPFFMPLVQLLGVDPLWFGVMFLICMQLGLLTPPFGLLLFTMKGVAPPQITMNEIFGAVTPYVIFGLVVLALIFFYSPIATWLPRLLIG